MKKNIKALIRPIRRLLTKIIVEPEALRGHVVKQIWEENNAFRWAAAYIVKNQISGDYLEFGVWKGNSFVEMYRQITQYSEMFFRMGGGKKIKNPENSFEKIRYHAFDSFDGLPQTKNPDSPVQYFKGNYKAEENVFRERIEGSGVDMSRVTITKGWFNETLKDETAKKLDLKEVSIAYVDCDIYESTQDVLNFLTPFLKTGSVIIFDDWFRNRGISNAGVQGATLDWLENNKQVSLQHFQNFDTRTAVFIVQIECTVHSTRINCV